VRISVTSLDGCGIADGQHIACSAGAHFVVKDMKYFLLKFSALSVFEVVFGQSAVGKGSEMRDW
jgi:hypothetical protein